MRPHNDPTQAPESRHIKLIDPILQQLTLAPNGWGSLIASALIPYRLSLSAAPDGICLEGDSLAVGLGGDILEAVAASQESRQRETRASEIIRNKIANALRHELAFRLIGMPHPIHPLSLSQVAFMNALLHSQHALILGVGPTGTGKTHFALSAGLNALALGKVKKLVASRPHLMMEGEQITGSIRAETSDDHQLTPIEDELRDLLGHAEVKRLKESEQLEILPLGFMRGRTFNDAFIVIDDAQNLTIRKMRMAVTRMGRCARMVITGDPRQIDLHEEEPSGLPHLLELLSEADIALICEFPEAHIVRNKVVARLEALYSNDALHRGSASLERRFRSA